MISMFLPAEDQEFHCSCFFYCYAGSTNECFNVRVIYIELLFSGVIKVMCSNARWKCLLKTEAMDICLYRPKISTLGKSSECSPKSETEHAQ